MKDRLNTDISHTQETNFIEISREESRLLEPFSHQEYWDSNSHIYTSSLLNTLTNEKLITNFIFEILGGEQHEAYACISKEKANILLRQMAMFEVRANKKRQLFNVSEAKLATNLLLNFIGPKAEFFTNAQSIEQPHDNPGKVMSNDSESTYRSICFFAINENYIVFINQYW
jgi:hypothetical protein